MGGEESSHKLVETPERRLRRLLYVRNTRLD